MDSSSRSSSDAGVLVMLHSSSSDNVRVPVKAQTTCINNNNKYLNNKNGLMKRNIMICRNKNNNNVPQKSSPNYYFMRGNSLPTTFNYSDINYVNHNINISNINEGDHPNFFVNPPILISKSSSSSPSSSSYPNNTKPPLLPLPSPPPIQRHHKSHPFMPRNISPSYSSSSSYSSSAAAVHKKQIKMINNNNNKMMMQQQQQLQEDQGIKVRSSSPTSLLGPAVLLTTNTTSTPNNNSNKADLGSSGPDPETLPTLVMFAAVSPPPSSLPLPKLISLRPKLSSCVRGAAVVDTCAGSGACSSAGSGSDGLCRILKLR